MDKTLLYYTNKGGLLTFENYTINKKGEIKNKKTGKTKTTRKEGGYYKTGLIYNRLNKTIYIHRAVLSTFDTDGYFENAQVNHIDENKDNNCLDNLEWLSPKDNTNHGTGNDRRRKNHNKKAVLCYDLNDNFVKEYESLHATEIDGFQHANVMKCCQGKRKTHKNHKFYYKNC